jgi:CRP-like cAMP-binding protein
VYFPQSGIVSVMATFGAKRDIEVGLVGREGMTGTALVQLDTQSPHTAVVQVAGHALRLPAIHLMAALERSKSLRALLTRYARSLAIQASYTAVANGRAQLEVRLARWLLMVHDRIDGNSLALTHDYMATMLGARRPGVTLALHILEGKGVIRSRRGEVVITDRRGLVAETIGAYGQPEEEYARLTGIRLRKMSNFGAVSSSRHDLVKLHPAR